MALALAIALLLAPGHTRKHVTPLLPHLFDEGPHFLLHLCTLEALGSHEHLGQGYA